MLFQTLSSAFLAILLFILDYVKKTLKFSFEKKNEKHLIMKLFIFDCLAVKKKLF